LSGKEKKGTEVISGNAFANTLTSEPEITSVPFFSFVRANAAWLALALLALAFGVFLRVWQLGDQILLDDEWHALHKLLHADAHDIATHLGLADYSIPLTLYYRFLYLHGGLSEWGMRLPILLGGIALVALAPWLLRRNAQSATLAIWTALLAISPFMIYHSRTARPYALTTLLVFVAVIAFRESWRRDERRWPWALAYVVCAFLAGWLHLITLPFTLLPFIFCGIAALGSQWTVAKAPHDIRHSGESRNPVSLPSGRSKWIPAFAGMTASEKRIAAREAWHRIGTLLLLGVITALPLVAALLPPLLNDFGALAGKSGSDAVSLDTVYRAMLLAIGSANPFVFAVTMALCITGIVSWWRHDAAFVGYIGLIVLGGAAAIALAHPAWVQHPGTYARYLQPVFPFLLLFVAEGLAVVLARLPQTAQVVFAAVALAALFSAGPIPGYAYAPNQFMGHPYFQFDYDAAHNPYHTELPDGPVSEFYRRLAARPPGSLTLIEAPWSLETNHDPEPLYQRVHHQLMRIGLTSPLCGVRDYGDYPPDDAHMQLTQFTHLAALLSGAASGADLLVMHRHPWPANLPPAPQWPDMTACLPQIEQQFGTPLYHDDEIDVYALSDAGRAALR
jgi:hypothetical protein